MAGSPILYTPQLTDRALMETSFLRLNNTRVGSYLGLRMSEGVPYRFPQVSSRDYAYIEIPVQELYNPADECVVTKALRNQYIRVIPACTVNVKGHYRFEVHPNPALNKFGPVQAPFYLEPEDGEFCPSFYIALRRDMSITDIDWAIRIYMRA